MLRFAHVLSIALILLTAFSLTARAQEQDPVRRLQPLIGTWDVDDTYQPIRGNPIRETGTRTCAWVLANRYVECVTRGRNAASGREREYRWLINYNTETGRYDLVGMFSNYPGKVVQTIRIDSTGNVWNIRAPSSTDNGIEQWHWAQLVFESPDRAVWTSYRNLETTAPTDWVVGTRESWLRRR